jgi:hypothetical protein
MLTLLVGLWLVGVGLGPESLPYSPWQKSPTSSRSVPPGWPFSDAVISHWPNALFLQRSVQANVWPLWRPLWMSGQPFAANPLNKVWYPPQWLAILLPATLHLNLMLWGHLVLAGSGMRALSLRLGLGTPSASIIGIAYAFLPRLAAAAGAGHLDIVYAAAWFPWVAWATHRAVTDPGPFTRRGAILGTICALCFLADIRLSIFAFATAFILGLGWSLSVDRARRLLALLAALGGSALALGLTAVQWLPLLDLAPYLSRAGMTVEDAGVFSLQPIGLIGLLFPDRGGFHETMVYVGIVILILAVSAFVRSPRRHALWVGVALVAMLYAFGSAGPLWPILVRIAPPLLWFRVPSRAWIVAAFAILTLAGHGLDALLAGRSRRTVRRTLPLSGVMLVSVGIAFGVVGTFLPLRPGASLAALVGMCGLGLILLARQRLPGAALPLALGLLIALDLLWTDVSLVAGLPQSIWLDTYQPVASALLEAGVTRVYSPDYSLPQQAAAYWNIPTFGGVDPFQLRAYVAAFEEATGIHAPGYSVTLPAFNGPDMLTANRNTPINADALAAWNVSHVLAGFPVTADGLRLVRRIGDLYLYQNLRLPSGVHVTWDRPNRFTASNSSPRSVNIAAWSPGWQRTDDDTAITVQPGQTITQVYDPPGLLPGGVLSALSLIVTGAFIVVTWIQRQSTLHLAA